MPHFEAIARAVLMLSPVTIRTVIPARWHFFIASGTCLCKKKKACYCSFHVDCLVLVLAPPNKVMGDYSNRNLEGQILLLKKDALYS